MSTENNYQIPQEKNFISLPTPELNLPKELFSPVNNTYNSLQQCRIIQKHLVYIIGLSINLINKDSQLKNFEYFGQYGKIVKLVKKNKKEKHTTQKKYKDNIFNKKHFEKISSEAETIEEKKGKRWIYKRNFRLEINFIF